MIAQSIDQMPALARETTGERITRLRHEREWTQMQLAEEVGISQAAVSYIERDESEPLAGTLAALAKAFEVSMDYLYRGVEHVCSE